MIRLLLWTIIRQRTYKLETKRKLRHFSVLFPRSVDSSLGVYFHFVCLCVLCCVVLIILSRFVTMCDRKTACFVQHLIPVFVIAS